MSIVVSNIQIGLNDDEEMALEIAKKRINVNNSDIEKIYIYKKSLDARKRDKIIFVVSVIIDLFINESEIVNAISDNFVVYKQKKKLDFTIGTKKLESPIVIIGFGPAGIFAAYTLAKLGYKPIVFERGCDVDKRADAVSRFWDEGKLDTSTNVQFGEGGAGTFSDGKLTTRISDSLCDYVLEEFVNNGAPEDILKNAKPHIGTDKLRGVIKSMRGEIIKNGGEIYFEHCLEDIVIRDNKICSVIVSSKEIKTNTVVLSIGHSARDTFQMIFDKGIAIQNKSFSVGVRIEQLQTTIDKGLYGDLAGHKNLPTGEYQLSYRNKDRCVYTFCMCPGGLVVPSSSSENSVVTNGMSEHARNAKNANSALVVSVDEKDYGNLPLAGMKFQQSLEEKAFLLGGNDYKAPCATVEDLLSDNKKLNIKDVLPTYSIGVTPVNFNDIFSNDIMSMLKTGVKTFNQRLKGFSNPHGIITGVETRTSSPVRILRGEAFESVGLSGLYPCGEGAGYAGGIVSAAVDGIRIAQKIASIYSPY